MAYEFDIDFLRRKLNPGNRPRGGDFFSRFLPAYAPKTPEEYQARERGTPSVDSQNVRELARVAKSGSQVAPPVSADGPHTAGSLGPRDVTAFTKGPIGPYDVETLGGITRTGNTFSGEGTAQQADLGSTAHLLRIAAAERTLNEQRAATADAEGFASGRNLTRAATPQELADERLAGIGRKQTVAGRKLATELYLGQLAQETARGQTAAQISIAGNRSAVDQQKLLLDAITTGANARKAGAEADLLGQRGAAVAGGDYARAAALAGRTAPKDNYAFIPGLNPNEIIVGNRGTGATEKVTPTERTQARIVAGKGEKLVGGKWVPMTPEEQARFVRAQ